MIGSVEIPDRQVIEFLRRAPVTAISDALTRSGLANVRLRGVLPLVPFGPEAPHMAGPAVTIRFVPSHHLGQHLEVSDQVQDIVDSAPSGSVIVMQAGDRMPVQGEISCRLAIRAGLAGTVGDGPVRDVDVLRTLSLPIFHKVSPIGVTMETYVGNTMCVGSYEPIECGTALVRPDDVVVGDNNGVVVIPRDRLDEVAGAAQEILGSERSTVEGIAAGLPWRDIERSREA